jgi:peroxiredoxin
VSSLDDPYSLPPDLPRPQDDGAAGHLAGLRMPDVSLGSTADRLVNLAALERAVIFCYPRTGSPDIDPPGGTARWNAIPGARGCTLEACAFRDLHSEFRSAGFELYGLSTQSTAYQSEAADRLHLTYELLSDADLVLTRALQLPTFWVGSEVMLRRLTLVVAVGRIAKAFYPVFPPDRAAVEALDWIRTSGTGVPAGGDPPPAEARRAAGRPLDLVE